MGTKLGFYNGVTVMKGDQAKDRWSMIFRISGKEEKALERTAQMGVANAVAFSFGDVEKRWKVQK